MLDLLTKRRRVDSLLSDWRLAESAVGLERTALTDAQSSFDTSTEAQGILQTVAQKIQAKAHERIASVVSRCLEAVFGPDAYEFQIFFERKRGKTEARLAFVRDGKEHDPLDSSGGGVVDVAAFALRLACLTLALPRRRRLLVIDEPFKMVSAAYRPAVRQLVQVLAKEMGMQFVIVSHSKEFMIGKVIEIG